MDIAAVSGTPLRGIVGHHKNAGTWLKGYGDTDPPPLAQRLRSGLDSNVWPTLVSFWCFNMSHNPGSHGHKVGPRSRCACSVALTAVSGPS